MHVSAAPKLQSSGFPSEISLGDDTVATCLVKRGSSGPFTMTWHKDGEQVRSSNRVTVLNKSNSVALSIEAVRVEDIGNYTCAASNDFGTDALTLSLVVTGDAVFMS